jgi:hypothetical protein
MQPDWKIVAVISDFIFYAPYDLNGRGESLFIFVTRRTRSGMYSQVCFPPLFAVLYPFDPKESRELEALGFSERLEFLTSTSVCRCSVCERESS